LLFDAFVDEAVLDDFACAADPFLQQEPDLTVRRAALPDFAC
jgi:hypothetical protein